MLDTHFPRPLGDMGQPQTYAHMGLQAEVLTVPQASARRVIEEADPALLHPFVEAARTLEARGVDLITTSCGFLVLWQKELQALSPVPVITSSLCLLPELLKKESSVGVLSIDAHSLTPMHWAGAGLDDELVSRLVVKGMPPESHFCQSILGNQAHLDAKQAQQEVVAAATSLVQASPQIKTLVLECTNLPPYQSAIEMATGLKVLSLRDNPVLDKAANE